MIQIAIIVFLAVGMVLLVRRGLIQVDLSFPWLLAIVVLGALSMNAAFVDWVGLQLGILYAPTAIIFVTVFFLLALIIILMMAVTRLRSRQAHIVRRLAKLELLQQETLRASDGHDNMKEVPEFGSDRED